MKTYPNFSSAISSVKNSFRDLSVLVHPQRWQGMDVSQKKEMSTYEILNHSFMVPINVIDPSDLSLSLTTLAEDIKPNLPWADDHFLERVGGQPLNPGVEWANWPYASSADRFRQGGQFTHSYMERMWPKYAGKTPGGIIKDIEVPGNHVQLDRPNRGYRYELGDASDLVNQLAFEPDTRQAYLPIWFPEDTGAIHKGRLPCSIGYHFIMRRKRLHVVYQLRSCDFVRHFRDDVYLTVRLLLWVLEGCRRLNPEAWNDVLPGMYTMHITSFHMFLNDYHSMWGKDVRTWATSGENP